MAPLFGPPCICVEISPTEEHLTPSTVVDPQKFCRLAYYVVRRFVKKCKGSPYSITEHRVPELIPVLGSQPASDVSHKPDGRLPLLSARRAVIPATLKRTATSFAA